MKSNLVIKNLVGTLFFFGIIFVSAGHLDYWQGCVYVIIGLIMLLLNYTVTKNRSRANGRTFKTR